MAQRALLHCFVALGVFQKGVRSVVQTQQTVVAAVGDEACLNCQLIQSKDVVQVTWQKEFPGEEKNVATYSTHFGPTVNPDFRDKVEFKDAGLQSCSIVIRGVSQQDEGCYRCLFITYPDGALTGRTCLQLYELHEPILHVRESDSTEESVVSCSATGRPAPTVTLSVTQPHLHFSHHNTVSVAHTDGTVTVNATAVLSGFRGNSAQVGCAARVLSGHKEAFMMIPELRQTSADGLDEESGSENRDSIRTWTVVAACVCVAAVTIIIIIIIILLLHKHKNRSFLKPCSPSQRDSEKNKTPQRSNKGAHETFLLPPFQQENEQTRQRTPTKMSSNNVHPETSHLTSRRLF